VIETIKKIFKPMVNQKEHCKAMENNGRKTKGNKLEETS
jgi:hypothetical protein